MLIKNYEKTCPNEHEHDITIWYKFSTQEFKIGHSNFCETMWDEYLEKFGRDFSPEVKENFEKRLLGSKYMTCSFFKEYPKKGTENGEIFNEFDKELINWFKKDIDLANEIVRWKHVQEFGNKHSVFCSGKPCSGYQEVTEQTCKHCREEVEKEWESFATKKLIHDQNLEEIQKLHKLKNGSNQNKAD